MADEENNMDEEPKEEINEGEGEEEKKEDEPLLDSDGNPINPEDLKPKVPEAPLKLDVLRKSVKRLQRTYDGLSYAYTEIDLKEKEIDDIGTDIDNFTQILDFNVSTNKITHINCVKNMPYIIRIDASVNEIKDIEVFNNPDRFQYLQILNLKTNKIRVLPEMQATNLLQIDLSENKVKDCNNFKGLPNLKKLNLNNNSMANCIGLANCPKLEVLYLNNNKLTSIKGLDNLPTLRKLRLRTNKIETFDVVPNLPNLEKLAISENLIKKNTEFAKLKFPSLKRINIDGNPYFDESGANPKIEVLIQLEGFEIKFVNKEEITQEDRDAVPGEKQARKEKEEEERKQREEEERIKKEEEEKERLEREEEERKKKEEEKENEEANKEGEEANQENNENNEEQNGEEQAGGEEEGNDGGENGEEGDE